MSKEVWSCNSKNTSGESCVFEVLSAATRRKFEAVIRRKLCDCSLELGSVIRKKASGERLRRKLCFVCNSKEASGENCVFDAVKAYVEASYYKSQDASGESSVFGSCLL